MSSPDDLIPTNVTTGPPSASAPPVSPTTPTSSAPPAAPSSAGPAPGTGPTSAPVSDTPLIAGVGTDETVQGQLNNILNADSPLLQNARTRAQEAAAGRGLQNSSLAAGSGERALIETSLPVAQQDASTNAARVSQNLTTQNQFGLQAQGIQGQRDLAAQDLASKQQLLDADTQARLKLLTQEGAQNLQAIVAQGTVQQSLQKADEAHQLLMQSIAAGNDLKLADKNFQSQMALQVADYGNKVGLSTLEQTQQLARMNLQHTLTLSEIDAQAKAQGSQFSAQLGSQYLAAVSDRMHAGSAEVASIYQTQGLTAAQQTAAVQNAYNRMNSDVTAIGAYYRQSPNWNPAFAATPPAPAAPGHPPAGPPSLPPGGYPGLPPGGLIPGGGGLGGGHR